MAYCWEKNLHSHMSGKKSHLQRFRKENYYPDLITHTPPQKTNGQPLTCQVKSLFNPWIH